ncbi:DUF1343 domain-containing protein [bacterium]|nr:DUF1343 domain-containing protein [bacterium]
MPKAYSPKVKLGVDRALSDYFEIFQGKNIGLIVNQGSLTSGLTPTVEAFYEKGLYIASLFAPEHGLHGEKQAGEEVITYIDKNLGLPVYSLYGETRKPTPEMLEDIDMLVWDIPEIGARYSTYIATMVLAMEAAAERGITFIVLDRPNPISGKREGNILRDEFRSFVGFLPIPMRHGLTPAEIALFAKDFLGLQLDLKIIPMLGWKRDMFYDDTGLLWINPSPNLPNLENVLLYPGACLLEGTNISEGRGTNFPFQVLGAPWIDGFRLAKELNHHSEGVFFRSVRFVPSFSKYKGELCEGVAVHLLNPDVDVVMLYLFIIQMLKVLYPKEFQWLKRDDGYVIDYLVGDDILRGIIDGINGLSTLLQWEEDLKRFEEKIKPYLLYE